MRAPCLIRSLALLAIGFLLAGPICAQRQKRDPLTEKQSEQIAEAGINPNERVTLYCKFLSEHVDALNALARRANSDARNRKIAAELEDTTALLDELDSNLDIYAERKADLRKSLKALNEAIPHWQQSLHALLAEAGFELERKEAIESAQELSDDAARLLSEQKAYFQAHKDEAGQDRWEPHDAPPAPRTEK